MEASEYFKNLGATSVCISSQKDGRKHFQYEKRNLSTRPNPCCSRRCGGIKSHWK